MLPNTHLQHPSSTRLSPSPLPFLPLPNTPLTRPPHQPIYGDHPSPSLWQLLRRRHLLHPTGLPLFKPLSSPTSPISSPLDPLLPSPPAHIPRLQPSHPSLWELLRRTHLLHLVGLPIFNPLPPPPPFLPLPNLPPPPPPNSPPSLQPIYQDCDHPSLLLWQLLRRRHLLLYPPPIYQDCDHPSPLLWQLLQRCHLLHPSGLPLFNPDWSYRQHHAPLSAAEARTFPPVWLVVLASRLEGGARALVNKLEVETMLVRRFGRKRVVVFDGSMPILQARLLFRRTRFLMGVHGAALTNTIFMPEGAALLEMRPRDCHITVFHPLCCRLFHRIPSVARSGELLFS
ncbi:unnamed protein product [Closterium sp. Naga37s-1]|nr:unnamed protein product [Closterium sp. Naga37s-1]